MRVNSYKKGDDLAGFPVRRVRQDRRIPGWAANLSAKLAEDRPPVVTRAHIGQYLTAVRSDRNIDMTIRELVRLGWLSSLHLKGVWAYVPPGESDIIDPYIDLRGWHSRDLNVVFALAGEAAAWHMGYLDRRFNGSIAIWLPDLVRPAHGLRRFISVVHLGWGNNVSSNLGPSIAFLHRKKLDLTSWASGLPAFGPEALVVQLAVRPKSFRSWGDLIVNLDQLVADCEPQKLIDLLGNNTLSTWQRAAYLAHFGGATELAEKIMERRPPGRMPHVTLGDGHIGTFSSEFVLTDRLIAPLQAQMGKA